MLDSLQGLGQEFMDVFIGFTIGEDAQPASPSRGVNSSEQDTDKGKALTKFKLHKGIYLLA
jgi:hypothetical protein